MVRDSVSDFINRIKTAGSVGKESIRVPHSQFQMAIGKLLQKEGYVSKIEKKGKKTDKYIEVELSYIDGTPKIKEAVRISKPGRRVYYSSRDISPVRRGTGLLVLSTPAGILSGYDAKKANVGGEALFKIW